MTHTVFLQQARLVVLRQSQIRTVDVVSSRVDALQWRCGVADRDIAGHHADTDVIRLGVQISKFVAASKHAAATIVPKKSIRFTDVVDKWSAVVVHLEVVVIHGADRLLASEVFLRAAILGDTLAEMNPTGIRSIGVEEEGVVVAATATIGRLGVPAVLPGPRVRGGGDGGESGHRYLQNVIRLHNLRMNGQESAANHRPHCEFNMDL